MSGAFHCSSNIITIDTIDILSGDLSGGLERLVTIVLELPLSNFLRGVTLHVTF